jgi:cell wall-associated NlpC family hydrolase
MPVVKNNLINMLILRVLILAALAFGATTARSSELDVLIDRLAAQQAARDSRSAEPSHPSVSIARKLLGIPYRWGGMSVKSGFDCSGLVFYVFKQLDKTLPRMPRDMFKQLDQVAIDDVQPGDIVFFNTFAALSHVGIYIGNRQFIHAPTKGKNVSIDSIDSDYYAKRLVGVRRISVEEVVSDDSPQL